MARLNPRYDSRRQRRVVIVAMMAMTIAAGLYFAVLSATRGMILLALIVAVFVIYSLVLFPVMLRTARLRFWALAYLIPWMLMIWAILALPQSTITSFIWPVLVPLVLHFMLGWRLGLALSLAALAGTGLIAVYRFGLPATAEELALASNFGVAALAVMILGLVYDRSRELAERDLRRLAVTDALTGLPNRMMLNDTFERLVALCNRSEQPLSLLLMDLDHFKQINDCFGHSGGDEVLIAFSRFLQDRLRRSDFACRHGGEEFLVLLPGSGLEQAASVAEEIRHLLESTPVDFQGRAIQLTASIGVAELGRDGDDIEAVLHVADERMYHCKEKGRNRVAAAVDA